MAKIIFAHEVDVIDLLSAKAINRESPSDIQRALADEELQLSATDFSAGPISAIRDRNVVDLVTQLPDGRDLSVGPATVHVSNESGLVGEEIHANVNWTTKGDRPFPAGYTLAQADPRFASCTRYIAATLSAKYKSQTAQWKAIYLLGCRDGMLALDLVMGNAVPTFWEATVYPHTLLREGGIRGRNPAVQQWLHSRASASCTGLKTCYENGRVVIPADKIPAPYSPTSSATIAR